jgi:methylated-DNA-[protein]-cysteine S-methyltransferase
VGSELKYVTFDTDLGWVSILASNNGLLKATLPQRSSQEALDLLGTEAREAVWSPNGFADLTERLRGYFLGKRVAFPDKLDLAKATPFQRLVWEKTRLIPYAETRTYLWVAKQVGNSLAVRAVGQALGSNPLAIIVPCHRVIASDGRLGGFDGGIEMKRYLLWLEMKTSLT